ncbi:MAG: precorrin-6y C5,15-methyltransferase (decarboxylating) subunit CbiE [Alphaproteobacteria bacterium]
MNGAGMHRWLSVVGIGADGMAGISPAARTLIATAELLVGGARHLAMVPPAMAPLDRAERLVWRRPIGDTLGDIAARRGIRVTVLASGDPMWYGIGALLARHFPIDEITIVPHPGVFSLAASRLGWAIEDCIALSLHGRPLDSLRLHLAPGARLLLLSHDGDTPRGVAALLCASGWGPSRMTVFEHLGGEREAVFSGPAEDWGERRAADLNTIALECVPGPGARPLARLAGLPDDAFDHDGQLTKREIRAMTLARLAPLPGETLWDVGAGCGSIAIEWLRAVAGAVAIAVEQHEARAAIIARNAARLGVPGLRVVAGRAPEALAGLPRPDAIFIGGGIAGPILLDTAWAALRSGGRLVANAVSIEGERRLLDWRERNGGELTRIAVSRAEPLGAHHAWRPLLPVTQYSAVKPG